MSNNRLTTPDKFTHSLQEILDEAGDVCAEALDIGLHKGALLTGKEWRANAPVSKSGGDHTHYKDTIRTSKASTKADEPEYVVHSSKPGLPHLLEKGHATIGGGRVAPVVHIEPAANDGFDYAMEKIEEGLNF